MCVNIFQHYIRMHRLLPKMCLYQVLMIPNSEKNSLQMQVFTISKMSITAVVRNNCLYFDAFVNCSRNFIKKEMLIGPHCKGFSFYVFILSKLSPLLFKSRSEVTRVLQLYTFIYVH